MDVIHCVNDDFPDLQRQQNAIRLDDNLNEIGWAKSKKVFGLVIKIRSLYSKTIYFSFDSTCTF